jgi:uncharacterized protein
MTALMKCMSNTMDFISLLRPKRPDFLTTQTPEEQVTMGKHMDYVKDLIAQGKIVMNGTAIDGTIGVLIFRVDSADEARRYFYNDPAVIAGIGYPELHPFQIGHLTTS